MVHYVSNLGGAGMGNSGCALVIRVRKLVVWKIVGILNSSKLEGCRYWE